MSDAEVNLMTTEIVCNITLLDDFSGTETVTVVAKLGIGEASSPGSNCHHDVILVVVNDFIRMS